MKIIDHTGKEQTEAWLAAEYDGCHVAHATNQPKVFRITEIRVTEGPACFMADVRNTEGQPHAQQPVAFSWPSLNDPSNDLPDLSKCGALIVWTKRGVHQRTDGNGLTGFGLGGAYGPCYQSWVISPTYASDCIVQSGMKGGTNHRGPLRVTWQATDETTPPPPPPPPPGDELKALIYNLRALLDAAESAL